MEGKLECSWDGESMAPYSMEPYSCFEAATVHHLGAGVDFRTHHHRLFDRDFGWQFPPKYAERYLETTIEDLIVIVDQAERRVGL